MSTLKHFLAQLLELRALDEDDARALLGALADAEGDVHQKAAALALIEARGASADEVRGFARGMRAAAHRVETTHRVLVDTCGTGGDGSHSLNLSTATSLLVAALGLPVAKHGNRSVSSRSGSADVLEKLGLTLATDAGAVERDLATGFSFLFAPYFHPAMKQIMPVRRGLGIRTIFNLLGPLSNPAGPTHQLLGAYSEPVAELLAHAARGLGAERVFVVHGAPHWDEATPCGPFVRFDVRGDTVTREELDPELYGIPRCAPGDLAGGDADYNASRMEALLQGRDPGPHEDAVVLNAALVLQLVGRAVEPREAADMARAALHDGRSAAVLERLRANA